MEQPRYHLDYLNAVSPVFQHEFMHQEVHIVPIMPIGMPSYYDWLYADAADERIRTTYQEPLVPVEPGNQLPIPLLTHVTWYKQFASMLSSVQWERYNEENRIDEVIHYTLDGTIEEIVQEAHQTLHVLDARTAREDRIFPDSWTLISSDGKEAEERAIDLHYLDSSQRTRPRARLENSYENVNTLVRDRYRPLLVLGEQPEILPNLATEKQVQTTIDHVLEFLLEHPDDILQVMVNIEFFHPLVEALSERYYKHFASMRTEWIHARSPSRYYNPIFGLRDFDKH